MWKICMMTTEKKKIPLFWNREQRRKHQEIKVERSYGTAYRHIDQKCCSLTIIHKRMRVSVLSYYR